MSGQNRTPQAARKAPKAGSRAGKSAKPSGPWSQGWRLWVKRLGIAGAAGFALSLVLFAYAYARTDVPDPNAEFETQTTFVYYADGETELGRFAEQNRTNVALSDVPGHVRDAVIAAEDRSFWTNKGIDPKGIVRAAFNNASGGDQQGASTITQQYVKVFYLSQERTYTRKLKEAILSLKIQQQMSKEEILQGYLNTIYFGRGAYGIEAAAKAYFAKSAKDLTVREGAALAAILNSPENYDPADGKDAREALLSRYTYVIDSMDETGTLPPKAAENDATYKLPKFPKIEGQSTNGGQKGHVLKMVRDELTRLGFTDSEIYGGGLRVTTTFTRQAMRAAEDGVKEVSPGLKGLHAAVASVDPRSGALRGMYGGQDFLKSQINWARAGGAPGSTFKPFALASALDYGYSLKSTFNGTSPLEVGGTEFSNQGEGLGRSYSSRLSLLDATIDSVNTAYVDMAYSMDGGASRVVDTAVAMGIPRKAPGLDDTLSIVLGSATISAIDMANAYGTIAAEGKAKKVFVVERVVSADGSEEYKHAVNTKQAISEDVAADTSYALQQVVEEGTGTNANVIGRPIAGKTGTATTDGGRVRSSWFVGYTPQLATAVMYSRGNGNEPLDGFLDTFYGGEYPARTWAAVMSRAMEGMEIIDFPPPANLEHTAEGNEPLPTFTPKPSPTKKPSPTPSKTPSPTPTPTEEPTPSPTPTPTAEPSPTITPPGDGGGGDPPPEPDPGSGEGGTEESRPPAE